MESYLALRPATRITIALLLLLPIPAAGQERGSIPLRSAAERFYGVRSDGVGKVIGGVDARIAEHPWQVALLVAWIADPAQGQFCGGSLLSPEWVVTAAHCVDGGTQPEDVNVLAGTDKLGSGGERVNVSAIYVHRAYHAPSKDNDIALIRLHRSVEGKSIVPASVEEEEAILSPDSRITVTGWGVTETGFPSPQLKKINVPYQSREKCNGQASYNGRITENMICAGLDAGGIDSCQGDSGGPASGGERLVGIVSWGAGCAERFKYGVYTRVARFKSWLNTCLANTALCEVR